MASSKHAEEGLVLLLASPRVARRYAPTSLVSRPTSSPVARSFSWGAKHKWTTTHNSKSFRDKINKVNSRMGARYPYLEHQTFYRRFLPAHGCRSASHWKNSQNIWEKKADSEKISTGNQPGNEVEDWYARWERQQLEKFEAFKKKIDQDPFNALFGKSNKWLGWTFEKVAEQPKESSISQADTLKKKAVDSTKHDKAQNSMRKSRSWAINEYFAEGGTPHESKHTPAKVGPEEQEYDIDPITLRKIPKHLKPDVASKEKGVKPTQQTFDIPVKVFNPTPRSTTMPAKGSVSSQVDDWLMREGFGSREEIQKPMSSDQYGTLLTPKVPASKIESALDRQIQEKDASVGKSSSTSADQTTKTTDEDLESLRASDIRASVGKGVQQSKTIDVSADSRSQASGYHRKHLQTASNEKMKRNESDFKRLEHLNKNAVLVGADDQSGTIKDSNDSHANKLPNDVSQIEASDSTLAALLPEGVKAEGRSSLTSNQKLFLQSKIVRSKMQLDFMKVEYDDLRQKWLAEIRRLKARKAKKINDVLAEEVEVQKAAMEAAEVHRGEGDMAPNVHEFVVKRATNPTESAAASKMHYGGEGDMAPNVAEYASRDRWYKRKAPHAKCEMEAKMQQLAKDKALVREVRGIYEDTYGTIDTKHHQEQLRGEGDMSPNVVDFASSDRWYKRGAPFHSRGVVVSKEEKTSVDKNYTMLKEDPFSELLTKNTADTSTAILTSTLDKGAPQSRAPLSTPSAATNTTAHQIASLKAQVDKQSAQLRAHREEIHSLRASNAATMHSDRENKGASVRRMEPVFSGGGSGRRHKKEKKRASHRRKTFWHILLTGAITAACCYATGVAVELLKVNGL